MSQRTGDDDVRAAAEATHSRSGVAPAADASAADGLRGPALRDDVLRAATDAAGLGAWEYFPPDGRMVWSGTLQRLLGGAPEALGGGLGALFANADPRDAAAIAAHQALPDGERPESFEYRIIRPDGERRWLRLTRGGVARDAIGRAVHVYGCCQDVTDLRDALERAGAAEARLRLAVEALPFGFVIYDADDRLVLCNQPYLDLGPLSIPAIFPGAKVEDILRYGLEAGEYPEAKGREAEWLARRLALHAAGDNDFEQQREGGRWIRSLARRAANGDHVGLRLDITDQKRATLALERSRADALAASEAKTQFLARMSHEIRTPMNGVLGMTDLIARRMSDPELLAMLGIVRESGRLLMTVIDDILDVSRIEAGRIAIERAPFAPLAVVRQVVAAHRATAQAKRLALRLDAGPEVARARLGDAHRIAQVLHNLVGNAIKFTQAGEVLVQLAEDGGDVVISVRDQGIGMSPEQVAQVFDAFTQADVSITRRFGGTGLGLTIVKGLVDAMDGRIAVQTAPGQGACFTVRLPLPLAQ